MNRDLEERCLHLLLEVPTRPLTISEIEVQVKLHHYGVVVDAFYEGKSLGSTQKTYSEMGVEVNEKV